jgi:hypothetical protein
VRHNSHPKVTTRDDDKRAAKHHDRLAAEAIRYRPIHRERRAQAQEIDAHRQTYVRRRRAKISSCGRQARQDHVDAEGRQGRQRAKQQRKHRRIGMNAHGSGLAFNRRHGLCLARARARRGAGEGRQAHHVPGAVAWIVRRSLEAAASGIAVSLRGRRRR